MSSTTPPPAPPAFSPTRPASLSRITWRWEAWSVEARRTPSPASAVTSWTTPAPSTSWTPRSSPVPRTPPPWPGTPARAWWSAPTPPATSSRRSGPRSWGTEQRQGVRGSDDQDHAGTVQGPHWYRQGRHRVDRQGRAPLQVSDNLRGQNTYRCHQCWGQSWRCVDPSSIEFKFLFFNLTLFTTYSIFSIQHQSSVLFKSSKME